jgi:hypothetical protein
MVLKRKDAGDGYLCGDGRLRPSSQAQRGSWHPARTSQERNSGVGNGNRTRNRRSHSPVLCQLSYSHRHVDYSNPSSVLSLLSNLHCSIGVLKRNFPQPNPDPV